jgi:capsular exopolysaccharide synthesis family protein
MAKIYEALRRAEEERKQSASGTDLRVQAAEWDATPQTAPKRRGEGFIARWLARGKERPADTTSDLNKRRISLLQPESYAAEQFRTLRSRIDSLAAQRPLKTIAMTSANPGDGKTTASLNLAVVTAMGVGQQTLLIDCDLRRPSVHRSLGLEPKMGLAEILLDRATLDEALIKVEGLNLDVIAVRGKPSNPSELLASAQMKSLVAECAGRYDRVILDTPAALGLPDGPTVAELCDGVLVVVRAGITPLEDVEAALELVDRRRVIGLVLNDAEQGRAHYGYY